MQKRFGFTLAEVLITLAIIGIVVILTIPNLISNYKKNVAISELKEAYSLLNNAYKLSVAHNGEFLKYRYNDTYSITKSKDDFDKYLRPYLKILKDCETLTECGYSSDNPFTTMHTGESYEFVIEMGHRYYQLVNGMVLLYRDKSGNNKFNEIFLSVDLNGAKGPNILGVDLFQFSVVEIDDFDSVHTRLYNWDKEQIESECVKGSFQGVGCSTKIMNDGWKFADNYPYKF